ncbi:MAG TPA: hypothetical protein PLN91_15850, partial [Rhodanobacteraceae bacterium]|nr:hypothetical protein [Rhodanobacteraceae bacterium]
MELKAHFSNIHQVIIDHLDRARTEVTAAIAWFTDRDIFDVLCTKARSKIKPLLNFEWAESRVFWLLA